MKMQKIGIATPVDGFFTVFPIGDFKDEMPQDFPTQKEAEEYGDEQFGKGNYVIETPF